jgi:hypothetical protein
VYKWDFLYSGEETSLTVEAILKEDIYEKCW